MGVKKPSGRKVILLLSCAVLITGGLVFASINPAETSPKCMPAYMKAHGKDECLSTAKSSGSSIEVIDTDN